MKTFLNLTNGLEVAGLIKHDGYVRIQSTHLEQKLWSRVIEDLDYSFLLPVVSGAQVRVVDTSHRPDGVSRAIYQGLPWIRFALQTEVLQLGNPEATRVFVKGMNCSCYFSHQVRRLSPAAKQKLRYLRKFVPRTAGVMVTGHDIRLEGMSAHTERDGDYAYFVNHYHSALMHKVWPRHIPALFHMEQQARLRAQDEFESRATIVRSA